MHVIPRMQLAAIYGAPPVDFLPQQNPVAYEHLLAEAERFVTARFYSLLQKITPDPVVHIIKVPFTRCPFLSPFHWARLQRFLIRYFDFAVGECCWLAL